MVCGYDTSLLADAKRGRMDVNPSTGKELQALAKQVIDQPQEVIKKVKEILGR